MELDEVHERAYSLTSQFLAQLNKKNSEDNPVIVALAGAYIIESAICSAFNYNLDEEQCRDIFENVANCAREGIEQYIIKHKEDGK